MVEVLSGDEGRFVQDRFLAGGANTAICVGRHLALILGTGFFYCYLQLFYHTAGFASKMQLTGGLHNRTGGVPEPDSSWRRENATY